MAVQLCGKPVEEMKLCELGCGIGKACFTALLTQNFHSIFGVEDEGPLLQVGTCLKAGFQSHMAALWGFNTPPNFMLAEGTVLNSDWWSLGSDIYIAHTTLWDPDEVDYFSEVCESEAVPRGTVVITFSVQLTSGEDYHSQSSMQLLQSCEVELCWGTATVYIYQKADPVFIDIPSPREKANRSSSSNSSSSDRESQTEKKERKEPRAFFPDTESDESEEEEEEEEEDNADEGGALVPEFQGFDQRPKTAREPVVQEESPRPKTSRGRPPLEESPRPKTSRGPAYRD